MHHYDGFHTQHGCGQALPADLLLCPPSDGRQPVSAAFDGCHDHRPHTGNECPGLCFCRGRGLYALYVLVRSVDDGLQFPDQRPADPGWQQDSFTGHDRAALEPRKGKRQDSSESYRFLGCRCKIPISEKCYNTTGCTTQHLY